jgi:hypothetical protein
MRLSISLQKNPMTQMERKMEPSALRPRLIPRMQSGLGAIRRGAMRLQGGGALDPVGHLYASRRANLYNPDPFARQVLAAQRALAGQYFNPAFKTMPGTGAGFPYAEGGQAPDAPEELMEADDNLSPEQQQEKQIVIEAMLALEGRHPDPQQAIEQFLKVFGKAALQDLEQLVQARSQEQGQDEDEPEEDEEEEEGEEQPDEGGQEQPAAAAPDQDEGDEEEPPMQAGGGLLSGDGTGQSDEIEGSTPSGRRVLLSDGEYVIDAPTVAALGDGSTAAGARRLDQFRKQVREQAYGHDKQAKPMKNGGRAILVELG